MNKNVFESIIKGKELLEENIVNTTKCKKLTVFDQMNGDDITIENAEVREYYPNSENAFYMITGGTIVDAKMYDGIDVNSVGELIDLLAEEVGLSSEDYFDEYGCNASDAFDDSEFSKEFFNFYESNNGEWILEN